LTDEEVRSALSSLTIRDYMNRSALSKASIQKQINASLAAAPTSGDGRTEVDEVTIASGSGAVAWTSIDLSAFGVPAGAKSVEVLGQAFAGGDGDQLTITYRSNASGFQRLGAKTDTIQGTADSDSSGWVERIALTTTSLDYKVTSTGSTGDVSFEIRLKAYYLA